MNHIARMTKDLCFVCFRSRAGTRVSRIGFRLEFVLEH